METKISVSSQLGVERGKRWEGCARHWRELSEEGIKLWRRKASQCSLCRKVFSLEDDVDEIHCNFISQGLGTRTWTRGSGESSGYSKALKPEDAPLAGSVPPRRSVLTPFNQAVEWVPDWLERQEVRGGRGGEHPPSHSESESPSPHSTTTPSTLIFSHSVRSGILEK